MIERRERERTTCTHTCTHTHILPYLDGVQVSGAALKGPQALPSGKLTARGNRDTTQN